MSAQPLRADVIRIGVVGASVRGTATLERLLANTAELAPGRPVRVEIIDPYPPGSGRIWRDGQPQSLLMNTVAAQSTVFPDPTLTFEGPHTDGPTLAEWCRLVTAEPTSFVLPDAVRTEAAAVRDGTGPSRLLYGHYLRWAFGHVVASAPHEVDVRVTVGRVVHVDHDASAGETVLRLADGSDITVDAVVLALGWLDRVDTPSHERLVSAGNPIDQDLHRVADRAHVGVRGVGMGFFDVLDLLTVGRGGRHVEGGYVASGREPHLVVGSRRGIPYRAKPVFDGPPPFPAQRVLRAALPALIAARPVHFERDVLPLIERDALSEHAVTLHRLDPAAVVDLDAYLAGLADPTRDAARLAATHIPNPAQRLDLAAAIMPELQPRVAADGSVDAAIVAIVREDAAAAALGADSPLKMALHSYQAARGALVGLVAFGGLTDDSVAAYERYLDVAAAFGSGPPLQRTRELLAAHDAGLITFLGPGATFGLEPAPSAIDATGDSLDVDLVIDAWLPAPTVQRTADPLLSGLLRDGHARPAPRRPAAVDVRAEDGVVIGADGEPRPWLHSVGIPHQDLRTFTIIAPVPGTDSPVLREIDAAARSALRVAVASHAAQERTLDDASHTR